MSGYMKDKVAARKNGGKTTPAVTTPIANAHANAVTRRKTLGRSQKKGAQQIRNTTSSSSNGESDKTLRIPSLILLRTTVIQLFISSQSDFPLSFYDENKSARRIETVRISSPCGELRGLIQLALRRPGSPLELLSPVSIVQLFVSSQSDFPLRFYDENK
ncbi:hypothetical protein F2Q69_00035203 [Brassica cretica]|uniref:Uncharacterized protein n=1 Tax=Brassica cretica TaxID=69181 RepID=A0A8S9SQZ0_BRACR|nr:hypothetical protein F2Q69_00035203 [Brassica cretica]